jgi:hypothetical protein
MNDRMIANKLKRKQKEVVGAYFKVFGTWGDITTKPQSR